ncbi:MAG: DUF5906 domain-containing protein [Acidobacteria bacterium]|nr:DUF5906 domain-containing protein [Acidobacteriota bacterium]
MANSKGLPTTKQVRSRKAKRNGVIQEFNTKHAVVTVGGKTLVLNEVFDPIFHRPDITLSPIQDFKNLYSNRWLGKKNLAEIWLKSPLRRQYQGIIFAPPGDDVPPGFFNLWRGFPVVPKEGNCELFLIHLYDNVARRDDRVYEYLVAWMADAVQNPAKRPGTSIVLRGGQGVGKGITCSQFGRLFLPHFVHVADPKHLLGNFNSHLKDALVVFADEAFWPGDKKLEGVLKFLVTEDRLPVEYKGRDVIFVRNHIRLMVSSNNDWVVPAGLDERRFLVLDVGEEHKQDNRYFGALVQQMTNGGREALLDYLLHVDLTDIDLRQIPQTEALRETKILSMNPVERFWLNCLSRGLINVDDKQWPTFVSSWYVHKTFIEEAQALGIQRRPTESELGIGLKKLIPGLKRVRKMINGKRPYGYELPSLAECRAAFDRISNCNHQWT